MKKNYLFILSAFALLLSTSVNAQTRYVDTMFDEVTVTSNVEYGTNVGIITQAPAVEALLMDVYEPAGDTVTNRPVVIMLHTGSFLPAIANGQATGDKSDNAIAEICTRFAEKGYVAIALNYRLGWNPASESEDVRRSTLIQAAYRGLQDVKTAVRFLRKSAVEDGNPYMVGDNFAVGGLGTGGYLSLAIATLNDYESELLMTKFIDTSGDQPIPYIIPSILGNFEATDYGYLPTDTDGDGIPDMDIPMCIPNHVGYSSEVDMVFNAGGALPDISWLDAGEVPIASMQNILDPDAPYAQGSVIVPTTGEFVITAMGSQLVQEAAHAFGNNDVFEGLSTTLTDATYNNGIGADNAAVAGHDDLAGLFGIITPDPSTEPTLCGFQTVQNAPWDWWDNATYGATADAFQGVPEGTMGCLALLGNPDMSEDKAMAVIDMMDEFFAPRVLAALSENGPMEEEVVHTTTTVVDLILDSDDHTTLATAVAQAGLVEALNGEGPFTVFAPTNAAFDALPEGALDELLANLDSLTSILQHHVYAGSALAGSLTDGQVITTLNNSQLTVELMNDVVYIDGALVTIADIIADNGVVHVINAVLLPSSLNVEEILPLENDTYLYSIDIMGRVINKGPYQGIVFDIYESGRVVKRYNTVK